MEKGLVSIIMPSYNTAPYIRETIQAGQAPKHSKVVIFGLTFKENCPDTSNSKVDGIIKRLNEYQIEPTV